jgi:hypothetical protein
MYGMREKSNLVLKDRACPISLWRGQTTRSNSGHLYEAGTHRVSGFYRLAGILFL